MATKQQTGRDSRRPLQRLVGAVELEAVRIQRLSERARKELPASDAGCLLLTAFLVMQKVRAIVMRANAQADR